ncbi:MAG: hypothetical protein HYR96_09925 [Deltaproteobacteria bacterium]|nr:hypothetical protein [Deltaproteobacteria bacterium]MBI3296047.1 hypothetical protein [Deltaproteobacteria bacterium]
MTTKQRHLQVIDPNDPHYFGPVTRLGLKRSTVTSSTWIVFFLSQLLLLAAMTYYFVY